MLKLILPKQKFPHQPQSGFALISVLLILMVLTITITAFLANMRIELEGTRLMVWEAAYKYDSDEDASKAAYLAKQYADKMVLEVTDGAVQVLGGHGYVRDHPVELWLRNGRGFATLDGTVIG